MTGELANDPIARHLAKQADCSLVELIFNNQDFDPFSSNPFVFDDKLRALCDILGVLGEYKGFAAQGFDAQDRKYAMKFGSELAANRFMQEFNKQPTLVKEYGFTVDVPDGPIGFAGFKIEERID